MAAKKNSNRPRGKRPAGKAEGTKPTAKKVKGKDEKPKDKKPKGDTRKAAVRQIVKDVLLADCVKEAKANVPSAGMGVERQRFDGLFGLVRPDDDDEDSQTEAEDCAATETELAQEAAASQEEPAQQAAVDSLVALGKTPDPDSAPVRDGAASPAAAPAEVKPKGRMLIEFQEKSKEAEKGKEDEEGKKEGKEDKKIVKQPELTLKAMAIEAVSEWLDEADQFPGSTF